MFLKGSEAKRNQPAIRRLAARSNLLQWRRIRAASTVNLIGVSDHQQKTPGQFPAEGSDKIRFAIAIRSKLPAGGHAGDRRGRGTPGTVGAGDGGAGDRRGRRNFVGVAVAVIGSGVPAGVGGAVVVGVALEVTAP